MAGDKFVVTKATIDDINYIAKHLREADIEEVYEMAGETPKEALINSFKSSNNCLCFKKGVVPICCYGVVPALQTSLKGGCVWLLGTDDIEKYSLPFLRTSRKFISDELLKHKKLWNFVYNKNTKAIKWLEWLGFSVLEPEIIGINKKLFRFFYIKEI